MAEKLEGMNWLKNQIKKIEISNSRFGEIIKELALIYPGVYNKFESWTPLKLILLNYAFDVCSTIINKSFFKRKYYVDLFAGSGINIMRGTSDLLMGSPFITALMHGDKYNKMFFCESENKLFSALKARVDFLRKNNLECWHGDSNNNLDNILKIINEEKSSYSFFFVDPYTTEFSWNSMKKILNIHSDIVFTLMTSQIIRIIGLAKTNPKESTDLILDNFFGDNSWRDVKSAEDISKLYQKNILKERKDAMMRIIKIKSAKYNFSYEIIFITNKTKKECPWLKAIDTAKKEIEGQSDKAVELAMDIIKQRQQTLA